MGTQPMCLQSTGIAPVRRRHWQGRSKHAAAQSRLAAYDARRSEQAVSVSERTLEFARRVQRGHLPGSAFSRSSKPWQLGPAAPQLASPSLLVSRAQAQGPGSIAAGRGGSGCPGGSSKLATLNLGLPGNFWVGTWSAAAAPRLFWRRARPNFQSQQSPWPQLKSRVKLRRVAAQPWRQLWSQGSSVMVDWDSEQEQGLKFKIFTGRGEESTRPQCHCPTACAGTTSIESSISKAHVQQCQQEYRQKIDDYIKEYQKKYHQEHKTEYIQYKEYKIKYDIKHRGRKREYRQNHYQGKTKIEDAVIIVSYVNLDFK